MPSASVPVQLAAFAMVFLRISANFTSTLGIPANPPGLWSQTVSKKQFLRVEPDFTFGLVSAAYAFFTPSDSWDNACHIRITAAAGTNLAVASSAGTVIIIPSKSALQPQGLHHTRGMAGSGFRPLSKYSSLLPPAESGPWSPVPVWLVILSDQLLIVTLVSSYLTNKLIRRGPIPSAINLLIRCYTVHSSVSPTLSRTEGHVPALLTRAPLTPKGSFWLACVRPAASVRSEPGSNSQVWIHDFKTFVLVSN